MSKLSIFFFGTAFYELLVGPQFSASWQDFYLMGVAVYHCHSLVLWDVALEYGMGSREISPLLADKGTLLTSSLLSLLLKELCLIHAWPLQHVVRVRRRGVKKSRKLLEVWDGKVP